MHNLMPFGLEILCNLLAMTLGKALFGAEEAKRAIEIGQPLDQEITRKIKQHRVAFAPILATEEHIAQLRQ